MAPFLAMWTGTTTLFCQALLNTLAKWSTKGKLPPVLWNQAPMNLSGFIQAA
jgi:hypothetical protein